MKIEELALPARAYNCLRQCHIFDVEELCEYMPEDLLSIRNLGMVTLAHITQSLAQQGKSLRPSRRTNAR